MAEAKKRVPMEQLYSDAFLAQANAMLAEWNACTCKCGGEILRNGELSIGMCDQEHTAEECTEDDDP